MCGCYLGNSRVHVGPNACNQKVSGHDPGTPPATTLLWELPSSIRILCTVPSSLFPQVLWYIPDILYSTVLRQYPERAPPPLPLQVDGLLVRLVGNRGQQHCHSPVTDHYLPMARLVLLDLTMEPRVVRIPLDPPAHFLPS